MLRLLNSQTIPVARVLYKNVYNNFTKQQKSLKLAKYGPQQSVITYRRSLKREVNNKQFFFLTKFFPYKTSLTFPDIYEIP